MLIDDILTSGATAREIIRSILVDYPSADILVFTLANTHNDAILNQKISLASTNYVWQEKNWQLVEDGQEEYLTPQLLVDKILSDFKN